MVWDAQLRLQSILFRNLALNRRSFQKWHQKWSRTLKSTQFSKMVSEMLQDAQLMLWSICFPKIDTKSSQFSKMISEMLQDAQLRLQSIFFANWLEIDVISKNSLRNGLGHLVKALKHFVSKIDTKCTQFSKLVSEMLEDAQLMLGSGFFCFEN